MRIPFVERMRELQISWNDIAYILQVPMKTLEGEFRRNKEVKELGPKVVVRKRKTDDRMGLKIKQIRLENPQLPFRDFPAELKKLGFTDGEIPSYETVRRYLMNNGFILRKLIKKTLIHPRNKIKRLSFCEVNIQKDADFWDSVIWSDETTVRQMPLAKDEWIHVHKSVEKENLPVNPQVHSGGFSVMFWGCFSKLGIGPLVAIDGSMNSEKYISLLKDHLLPELGAAGREMTFMQDNAPCHKSKQVLDFFRRNGIKTMGWPPQSPDMNPIENLWAIIKKRRQKKFGIPATKSDLIAQVFQIWEEIEPDLLERLANSAIKRLEAVKIANGNVIKY